VEPIALRYLHRKNKATEAKMLELRDSNEFLRLSGGYEAQEHHDVEALLASLLMAPSHSRETATLQKALHCQTKHSTQAKRLPHPTLSLTAR